MVIFSLAERVGFEPTDAFTSPVFKTGAFNRSAISPDHESASYSQTRVVSYHTSLPFVNHSPQGFFTFPRNARVQRRCVWRMTRYTRIQTVTPTSRYFMPRPPLSVFPIIHAAHGARKSTNGEITSRPALRACKAPPFLLYYRRKQPAVSVRRSRKGII